MKYGNPYEGTSSADGRWIRANFHAHAGDPKYGLEVEDVLRAYKVAGYDSPCITNHGTKKLVLLDLEELQRLERTLDIAILNGYEYGRGQHLLCINVATVHNTMDDVQGAATRCAREGGFSVIAHPNDQTLNTRWTLGDALDLRECLGIEIVNGYYLSQPGLGVMATDIWDGVLSTGRLIWGFGNDDFHQWHHIAQAWNMVYDTGQGGQSLVEAVRQGRFYCTTGLELDYLTLDGDRLMIAAKAKDGDQPRHRHVFVGESGAVLFSTEGVRAEYRLRGDELYVRVFVQAESGATLWTQPIHENAKFRMM